MGEKRALGLVVRPLTGTVNVMVAHNIHVSMYVQPNTHMHISQTINEEN